jgi:hypothetical protein
MVSVSLFEGIILLVITGVFVVAWWGVKRIVKTNDDDAKVLSKINESLSLICQRLAKTDLWMDLHTKQDDERHEDLTALTEELRKAVDELKLRRM